jgi:hypothetical protein
MNAGALTLVSSRTVLVNNLVPVSSNGHSPVATIAASATALPPHVITRDDVKYYFGRIFNIPERRVEAMMSIVDNAAVNQRHSIFPVDYFVEPRPLSQTNIPSTPSNSAAKQRKSVWLVPGCVPMRSI